MTFSGHFIFSISIIIIIKKINLFNNLSKINLIKLIIICILSSSLPDLDHPNSIIGKKFYYISKLFYKFFGHRGFTHSILSIIIFYYILNLLIFFNLYIPKYIIYSLIIGYTSHIIGDMFTYNGVPLLWPCKWKFTIFIFKKKKNKEKKFCFIFFLISIFLYFLKI
ncbi:Inner membrane protein YdjM [Candidatus Annandia adelgestsuga]|uniref:Inner membrane protein YdjM n=1 Tax=Candidatus Annandia adelgestsuga TaxID=1302411 RepID=A0A3Q9CP70_9ENTR|nr:metal-dependent hydrolase [Candidatus Annandia adelgestsuga]AZP36263.1 Inner membrane protein YdjM [Candidatus Annandia adelgestsuga]